MSPSRPSGSCVRTASIKRVLTSAAAVFRALEVSILYLRGKGQRTLNHREIDALKKTKQFFCFCRTDDLLERALYVQMWARKQRLGPIKECTIAHFPFFSLSKTEKKEEMSSRRSTRGQNAGSDAVVNSEKSEGKKTWGSGGLVDNALVREFVSLVLIIWPPLFVYFIWYTIVIQKGSVQGTIDIISKEGISKVWWEKVYPQVHPWNPFAWKILAVYSAFELALMKLVPGPEFKATISPTGHQPVYKANGVASYFISIAALFACRYFDVFNPALVYDNLGHLLGSVVVFALIFCAFLSFKGLYFPSTKDFSSNGSLIIDYFWGTELYPRIFGWDVKQFTNCRFGMMYWQLGILCYAFKQYDTYGYVSSSMLISVAVQTVYVFKFFWWETGYFCSMDIQHDRAGFYICWGCLCWVPSLYTLHTMYLVEHPEIMPSPVVTALLLLFGLTCVWINYDCDRQRQVFRSSNGKAKVWGEDPTFITASYVEKATGETKQSLLLTSGWWGLSRHIHYIPEIFAAILWCVPLNCSCDHFLRFFYPIFLTILLFDRAWRDDKRCADKYGEYWVEYCKKVPYKIIPGVI